MKERMKHSEQMLFMSLKTAGEHSQLPVQAAEAEPGRASIEESPEVLLSFMYVSLSGCPVLTFACSKVSTVETYLPISSSFL